MVDECRRKAQVLIQLSVSIVLHGIVGILHARVFIGVALLAGNVRETMRPGELCAEGQIMPDRMPDACLECIPVRYACRGCVVDGRVSLVGRVVRRTDSAYVDLRVVVVTLVGLHLIDVQLEGKIAAGHTRTGNLNPPVRSELLLHTEAVAVNLGRLNVVDVLAKDIRS